VVLQGDRHLKEGIAPAEAMANFLTLREIKGKSVRNKKETSGEGFGDRLAGSPLTLIGAEGVSRK